MSTDTTRPSPPSPGPPCGPARYPAPVGVLLSRELMAWAGFGHRFGTDGLVAQLVEEILAVRPPTLGSPGMTTWEEFGAWRRDRGDLRPAPRGHRQPVHARHQPARRVPPDQADGAAGLRGRAVDRRDAEHREVRRLLADPRFSSHRHHGHARPGRRRKVSGQGPGRAGEALHQGDAENLFAETGFDLAAGSSITSSGRSGGAAAVEVANPHMDVTVWRAGSPERVIRSTDARVQIGDGEGRGRRAAAPARPAREPHSMPYRGVHGRIRPRSGGRPPRPARSATRPRIGRGPTAICGPRVSCNRRPAGRADLQRGRGRAASPRPRKPTRKESGRVITSSTVRPRRPGWRRPGRRPTASSTALGKP